MPFLYVLMTRRTQVAYLPIMEMLKTQYNIKVNSAMSDFEPALRNAIRQVYPDVILLGCWFHFLQVNIFLSEVFFKFFIKRSFQAVIRHIKNVLKHSAYMKSDTLAKVTVRRLLSLPLLPVDQTAGGFDAIRQTVNDDNVNLQRILVHFNDEWMIKVGPEDFCIHNIYDRTNNSSENCNYWFKRYFF